MKTLPAGIPKLLIDLKEIPKPIEEAFRSIIRQVSTASRLQSDVINFNSLKEYDQAAQPTIDSGELAIWKDSDAASSQPTHYLMYNQDGTTVTFASEETVP